MKTRRDETQVAWYGQFLLELNTAGFWKVGPFQLWACRSTHEWRVASVQGGDALDHSSLVSVPSGCFDPPGCAIVRRFGYQQAPETVKIAPVLADRPVVVSPEEPLYLPPREQITLFISTPVWIELTAGEPPLALIDEPIRRPTDTWFGPSSMRGELCYATRTAARMNLDNVPARPHRVISVVEVRNRARTILTVEKIKIPVVHLSVFATESGNLCTETVTLEHQEDGGLASVRLGKGPPENAPGAVLVRGPRSVMDSGLLTRAFSGFLS